jgi:hypothetical protein
MSGFKDASFLDRRTAAAAAKKAQLERFRAQPGADDPAVIEREKARRAIAEAREARAAEREASKLKREKELAEQALLAAELAARTAAEAAERAAREKREIADREVALNAERKAERDANMRAQGAKKIGRPMAPRASPRRINGQASASQRSGRTAVEDHVGTCGGSCHWMAGWCGIKSATDQPLS